LHLNTVGLGGDRDYEFLTANGKDKSAEEVVTPKAEKTETPPPPPPQNINIEVSAEDLAALAEVAGQAFAEELACLCKNLNDTQALRKKVASEPTDDRQRRGQIHQEVRRIFRSKVETTTNDAGAVVASIVPQRGGGAGGKGKKTRGGRNHRDRGVEDKPTGEYLHFSLFKENRDTMDAVNQISRFLKVRTQNINYAGTKDRRAATVQRCSVRYGRGKSLAITNGKLRGVVTGDYEYADHPLHLGMLLGNEFVITVKDCQAVATGGDEASRSGSLDEQLDALRTSAQATLDRMAERGWINYFGHQRFGTRTIGTHDIGKLILGERYEDAVNALLAYDAALAERAHAGEVPDEPARRDEFARHHACMLFLTGRDLVRAEKLMPRRFGAEVCILRHLNRAGAQSRRDYVGALTHITKGLRSMYLHAYQSHVWNHAASHRWTLHGDKVVAGDLVITEAEVVEAYAGVDDDGDQIINPVAETDPNDNDDDVDDGDVRALPLSAEEAASGRYTIHDVVLPSPGFNVVYPDNEVGTFYADFMAREENGGLDPHKMRRLRREFSLPGRYRKLMNRFLAAPSIEFKTYVDDTEQMHPTDLDRIKASRAAVAAAAPGKRDRDGADEPDAEQPQAKRTKPEVDDGATEANGAAPSHGPDAIMSEENGTANAEEPKLADDGLRPKRIAAVLRFQLAKSAYATVTLRELMGDPPEDPSNAEGEPKAEP
jgi:tRNA pseudouridine13 synthase